MKSVRSLRMMKRAFCVIDFSSESTVVLVAEKKEDGTFHVLGAGESQTRGITHGEITHLGDAVECLVEALRKAEDRSGAKIDRVYFNFDDPQMRSVSSHGTRCLAGEGEIQLSDIQEARETAERLVGHFEKSIVYSREISFLIDDRDTVENPVGVFGRKLDVQVHILQARSECYESWQKLIKRTHVAKGIPVPSCWSTAYGIFPKEDRKRKRFVADLGHDFLNFFIFENNKIADAKVYLNEKWGVREISRRLADTVREFTEKNPDLKEIFITGEIAQGEKNVEALKESMVLPAHFVAPLGISKLNSPKFASLVGLLYVAEELEKKSPSAHRDKGLIVNMKERAITFINEYF